MRAQRGRALRLATSFAVVLVVAGLATPMVAGAQPTHARQLTAERWTGVDVRAAGSAVGVSPRVADARAALAKTLGSQGVVQSDRTTGTLRYVGSLDGYLTGASAGSAASVALDYVRAHLTAFGLSGGDLATLNLRRDYVDVLGTHHLSWTQSAGGIDLFGQPTYVRHRFPVNPELLQKIAKETGGQAFIATDGKALAETHQR